MTVQTSAPARFPELNVVTPRLVVRPLTVEDAAELVPICDDKLTRRWLPLPTPYTEADARMWCTWRAAERRTSGDGDHYGIVRREDECLVGCVWAKRTDLNALVTEVSYAVLPSARGFGFAAEAVDALTMSLLLEHSFQRVELRIAPGNTASHRVAVKAGFTYEGLLRNAGYLSTGRVDLGVWSLVPADLRPDGSASP